MNRGCWMMWHALDMPGMFGVPSFTDFGSSSAVFLPVCGYSSGGHFLVFSPRSCILNVLRIFRRDVHGNLCSCILCVRQVRRLVSSLNAGTPLAEKMVAMNKISNVLGQSSKTASQPVLRSVACEI